MFMAFLSWYSTSPMAPSALSRVEEPLPSACGKYFAQCSLTYHKPSLWQGHSAGFCSTCYPPPKRPFLQISFLDLCPTKYHAWGCSPPHPTLPLPCAGLCISCWASGDSCQPISPTYWDPSGCQHNLLAHQPLLQVLCHQQTSWRYILSHHLDH